MDNNYLERESAPIGQETWEAAQYRHDRSCQASWRRRIIDIDGPFGFGLKASTSSVTANLKRGYPEARSSR